MEKRGHGFVRQSVRNVRAKFKVDSLSRFRAGARQVFTAQKLFHSETTLTMKTATSNSLFRIKKHIFESKWLSAKFLFISLTSNKLILDQKSKYLNSIRVFPFFHFIFLLKWNKQEIFMRRHEKDQKQTLQSATLFKKKHCHRCFPVNFVKFLRVSFLAETPPVADSERWKTVTPIILQINLFT